jgi:excisionase family DNA binding protein
LLGIDDPFPEVQRVGVHRRILPRRPATLQGALVGIGRTKAYELVTTGELPAVRIGRCIRINRRELDEWLHRQHYLNVAK